MKLLHLSDLHLGKRVNEFSMLEDQDHILREIVSIVRAEKPDAVLIAGDVYDKTVPPAEAVTLFDRFLTALAKERIPVFLISGNHDSAERLAFGAALLDGRGVYVAPVYDGAVRSVTLEDGCGPVEIHLLPFLRPAAVRHAWPEEEIKSYNDALRCAVAHIPLRPDARHVLLSHQFVTGAARCESEEVSVGGLDNVDAEIYAPFDYVALGHLHGPQNVSSNARYCGTPLKYSFSEAKQQKSVTIAELGEKGSLAVRTVPLTPRRDMREVRGSYLDLTCRDNYAGTAVEDYLHIILTDEEEVPDAAAKLRTIYPNLMRLSYDNRRTAAETVAEGPAAPEKTPLALLEEFYEAQNGRPLAPQQRDFARALIEKIWEEEP